MNKNQIEGSIKDVMGQVQQRVGQATGNTKLRVKGVAKEIAGKVEKRVGDVKQALAKAGRKSR